MLGVLLAAALAIEIPLLGAPLAPDVVQELNLLPGVERIEVEGDLLRLAVVPGRAVRYADIIRTIRSQTVATELDVDQIPLGRQTIFQMDAGQCFHCASAPLKKRLERKPWLDTWSVVGYAPKGRMHFRIEPKEPTTLDALGRAFPSRTCCSPTNTMPSRKFNTTGRPEACTGRPPRKRRARKRRASKNPSCSSPPPARERADSL